MPPQYSRVAVTGQGLFAVFTLRMLRRWLPDTHLYLITTNDRDFATSAADVPLADVQLVPRPDEAQDEAGATAAYVAAVRGAVEKWRVELVVPATEEGLYLAQHSLYGGLGDCAALLAPDLETMRSLHDKELAMRFLLAAGVSVPETHACTVARGQPPPVSSEWVVKPALGRGGRSADESSTRHVKQRKCLGKEYSSLTFFIDGEVVAHVCYLPSHPFLFSKGFNTVRTRCPPGSTQHAQSLAIAVAASKACPGKGYHGFMGFDLMEQRSGTPLLPIECNPRVTAGASFFFAPPTLSVSYTMLGGVLCGAIPPQRCLRLICSGCASSDEGTLRMGVRMLLCTLDAPFLYGTTPDKLVMHDMVVYPPPPLRRGRLDLREAYSKAKSELKRYLPPSWRGDSLPQDSPVPKQYAANVAFDKGAECAATIHCLRSLLGVSWLWAIVCASRRCGVPLALASVGLGTYLADAITGAVHMYLDHRRQDLRDGLDTIAYGFQEHHEDPRACVRGAPSAWCAVGVWNGLVQLAFPASALVMLTTESGGCVRLVLLTMFLVASLGQAIHAMAHIRQAHSDVQAGRSGAEALEDLPPLPMGVPLLQDWGIFLKPSHHKVHHTVYDRSFAIVNGWADPVLDIIYEYAFAPLARRRPSHFVFES